MTVLIPRDRRRSRYAFDWSARDCIERGTLDALTGQAATFTRNSVGYALDRYGRFYRAVPNMWRWQWEQPDSNGLRAVPVLLMEPQSTNLIPNSDDLSSSAGWTVTGTSAITPSYATFAGRPFTRVQSSSTTAFVSRSVSFTGNGIKALSFLVRANSATGATGKDVVLLHDVPANQERFELQLQFNADGTITFSQIGGWVGTFFTEQLADGVYRVYCITTSVTAANAHTFYLVNIPGTIGSGGVTDRLYSGVQVEDFVFPTSLMPTVGGTFTRLIDAAAWAFAQSPQAHSMYYNAIERSSGIDTRRLMNLSNSSSSISNILHTVGQFQHEWGGPDSNNGIGVVSTPAFLASVEVASSWNATAQTPAGGATVKVEASVNGVATTSNTWNAATRLPSIWVNPFVQFNAVSGAQVAPMGVMRARIAMGTNAIQPLGYMQDG